MPISPKMFVSSVPMAAKPVFTTVAPSVIASIPIPLSATSSDPSIDHDEPFIRDNNGGVSRPG